MRAIFSYHCCALTYIGIKGQKSSSVKDE